MVFAIETRNIVRTFKITRKRSEKDKPTSIKALDGVNLTVNKGELFGLLGPNGAGKTTLIKILCTLLLPTSGKAYVDGFDVDREAQKVRERINMVSGGETSGYGLLTVWENVWLFSQFYGVSGKVAKERIDALLKTMGLADKATTKVHKLSTGQRQKMNICRGFVSDPDVVFLDEPTLGLDVNAARAVRDYIVKWVKDGKDKTVLLTTHYMAEADELCDRVAIINDGKILACDKPENLKKLIHTDSVFEIETTMFPCGESFGKVPGVKGFTCSTDSENQRMRLKYVLESESAVSDIVSGVMNSKARILALKKTEPTLEDVFIKLVGRGLTSEE